jgi:hypothetical protein
MKSSVTPFKQETPSTAKRLLGLWVAAAFGFFLVMGLGSAQAQNMTVGTRLGGMLGTAG